MPPTLLLPAAAAAAAVSLAVYILGRFVRSYFSPARDIPGPPNPSLLWGHLREIVKAENSVLHEQWLEEYGPVVRYTGMFNDNRIVTMDPRALHHVLNDPAYEKPSQAQRNLAAIVGEGLLVVEGEEHRKQRRVMNPAFGPTQIREMTDIFVEKSLQLRDIWMSEISKSSDSEQAKVDAVSWLSKLTLDVIGLAGFNYRFDALNPAGAPNELNQAFSVIFQAGTEFSFFNVVQGFLQGYFPVLQHLPTARNRRTAHAKAAMTRIGRQLLAEKKAAVLAEIRGEKGKVGRDSVQGRDLLSLLVRANMATDLPESQRMRDEDVLAQVPTFLVAGHETTSTSTTWCLYALALAPAVQARLRAELLGVPTDAPSMDDLMALPYLDAVCRETLRVHAPVPSTVRVATREDVIPTAGRWVDRRGVEREGIRVAKGDVVFVPILALNRARSIWGDDAHEFRPERWERLPEQAGKVPGVWGNLLTFLGGAHACIGYRFSVVEMKAILFTLVRAFEFELAVPKEKIVKRSVIVTRPVDTSDGEGKNRLPLIVRPYRR
ncbi:cytochrome P450 [Gloeophyllum trabeum ATCC 11539]|uniref:Cytochrome P450 n=1 Tax=Gloeophyllum trabeum (strain ATCC 11539 / FP-39264 / Madison 617) TaxID=670483 RepID=S7PSD0_GLOTA|nr:cytochrome P450 [Gloeophyllum trabeum ATCC 11539]EPQ50323.1 cytochrome P450 [Gloeophyllum trabeum ATCC 11539]